MYRLVGSPFELHGLKDRIVLNPLMGSIKSISNRTCHAILFYPFKKLLYQLYHTILQNIQQPKILFFFPFYLNILFYSFFFYYFSFSIPFPLFLPQPLTPVSTHRTTHTQRSMIHQSTYPNPSPHTYKHKLSNHQLSHTHKPFKPIGANNSHHTHQSKPATTTTWSRA